MPRYTYMSAPHPRPPNAVTAMEIAPTPARMPAAITPIIAVTVRPIVEAISVGPIVGTIAVMTIAAICASAAKTRWTLRGDVGNLLNVAHRRRLGGDRYGCYRSGLRAEAEQDRKRGRRDNYMFNHCSP